MTLYLCVIEAISASFYASSKRVYPTRRFAAASFQLTSTHMMDSAALSDSLVNSFSNDRCLLPLRCFGRHFRALKSAPLPGLSVQQSYWASLSL